MKKAVLFIHGFSAYPEENEYFINVLKHKTRIDIHTFFLPGHGDNKIKKAKRDQWIEKAETELKEMLKKYSKIIIVAHSMGGVIASLLASRYSNVEKLVLIAPAFRLINKEQNMEDIKSLIKRKVDPNIGTGFTKIGKIKRTPLYNFLELNKIIKENQDTISKVTCPVLILHGDKDNIVPMSASFYAYDQAKGKKQITILENVRHQVFTSPKKEIITRYIVSYILEGKFRKFKRKDKI